MKMKFLAGVGVFLLLIVGVVFLVMFGFGVGVFAENVQAKYDKTVLKPKITQQVYQPDNALAIYAQFRNDCRAVVALNQEIPYLEERYNKLNKLASEGDNAVGTRAQAAADALNDLTGAKNQRVNVAQQYNARSANFSKSVFKNLGGDNDPVLPERIEEPYTTVNCEGS
jgi:hypothetical protein